MAEIIVEHTPDKKSLEDKGVFSWPIWTHEAAKFDWEYSDRETCYLLEGDVTVTPANGGAPARFGAGDLVIFPAGMKCIWEIHKDVRKHYYFG